MSVFNDLNWLMVVSACFWLFVFFVVLGPCLIKKYLWLDDTSRNQIGLNSEVRDGRYRTVDTEDTRNTEEP